jgi:hypothetical protein
MDALGLCPPKSSAKHACDSSGCVTIRWPPRRDSTRGRRPGSNRRHALRRSAGSS